MVSSISKLMCSLLFFAAVFGHGNAFAGESTELFAGVKSSDYKTRLDSLKIIERTMVVNQEIFDYIQSRLFESYQSKAMSDKWTDEMAWCCKALASSADKKYIDTLKTVSESTDSPKLKRHCSNALEKYEYYSQYREVMSKPKFPGISVEGSSNVHLISSGNPEMMRMGIRKIMTSNFEEAVFDRVRDVLLAEYNHSPSDSKYIDSLSWLCKGLATSGNFKYVHDLETVEKSAASTKLQKYARVSRKALQ
ncbi:MAG: hypothetical protein GY799_08710 [Desulfobulbaceae bacterium]|nr:hypothetical protein [Desulfobulbaceae bacterium]